jgi:hypothetical protein
VLGNFYIKIRVKKNVFIKVKCPRSYSFKIREVNKGGLDHSYHYEKGEVIRGQHCGRLVWRLEIVSLGPLSTSQVEKQVKCSFGSLVLMVS